MTLWDDSYWIDENCLQFMIDCESYARNTEVRDKFMMEFNKKRKLLAKEYQAKRIAYRPDKRWGQISTFNTFLYCLLNITILKL
jgi:hypothetical protein